MADETWLETLESWSEAAAEYLYGPPPAEVIRRASASIRFAVLKLERERRKTTQQEQTLIAAARAAAPGARTFADVRPALLAVANTRRSGARIDKLTLKMRSLQQQLIETEVNSTTATVMHSVTHALAQATAATGGLAGVQRMVMGYERQKALLEMTQESLGTLEEDEEDEETADDLLAQIAAEANLALTFDLPAVSSGTRVSAAAVDNELNELMERFQRLNEASPPPRGGGTGGDDAGGAGVAVRSTA